MGPTIVERETSFCTELLMKPSLRDRGFQRKAGKRLVCLWRPLIYKRNLNNIVDPSSC